MKELLIILAIVSAFVLLTLPAAANKLTINMLEHGKSYTNPIVSCNTADDVMNHIRDINQIQGQYTLDNIKAAITDNNCVSQSSQHYTYIDKEYVCSFSIQDKHFTLLNTKIEGIKQFIVVHGLPNNIKSCNLK